LKNELRQVFAHGRRRRYGKVTFIYISSEEQRAGFIASRNIGCAAKRNRARRILREAYRMNKEHFKGIRCILCTEASITLNEALKSISYFKGGR